jgi:hypothetical protein
LATVSTSGSSGMNLLFFQNRSMGEPMTTTT